MPSDFPSVLAPTTTESLLLPSGRAVDVGKAMPAFDLWLGETPGDTYGNKLLLEVEGECVFAELAILRLFQSTGWNGVWVDTFRNRYRTHFWNAGAVTLSTSQRMKLDEIRSKAQSKNGCWDIFCWRDDRIVFAESKRHLKDEIRPTQLAFLEAALELCIPLESFLLVEWTTIT